jgi:hypothetical protein
VVWGALFGIGLRLVYSGGPDDPYAAMTGPFIYFTPMVVGATTVYFAERRGRRTVGYHVGAAALANVLFVAGAMVILIEGLICAIIILPLFVLLGIFGALVMSGVCRMTNWPGPMISGLVLLPLLLGNIETGTALPDSKASVERTTVVRARPAVVWRELLNTSGIRADEVEQAWAYRIGVPMPLDGQLLTDGARPTRRVHMGKNVYFDEVIEEQRPEEWIRWTYRFYPDSFPQYAFDEHVVIGGRYFDVLDTSYRLAPVASGTAVTMTLHYRVSTRFNWYALPVSRWLLADLVDSNLNYYRQRSERAATD